MQAHHLVGPVTALAGRTVPGFVPAGGDDLAVAGPEATLPEAAAPTVRAPGRNAAEIRAAGRMPAGRMPAAPSRAECR